MGTNFYLRAKNPRPVYDQYHLAKTSHGWKPLFEIDPKPEDSTPWEQMPAELPIRSVDDIKRHYDSGNFEIVDEYGEAYDWDAFEERVINWNADNSDARGHDSSYDFQVMKDPQGYDFVECEFS